MSWNNLKKNLFKKKKKNKKKNAESATFSMLEVVMIIFISVIFGVIMGYMITYTNKISKYSKIDEIINTYHELSDNYYPGVSEDDLANAAIKGMVESLGDPYSSYLDKEESDNFKETVDGSFTGIGVTILLESTGNRIIEVLEDSPAEKAGLKTDDIIVMVDTVGARTLAPSELATLVRGEKGTSVSITVERQGEVLTFQMKRDTIPLPSVNSEVLDSGIGYIQITSFASNTYKQFKKALQKVEKENIRSLVIDVRNNFGGHLDQTKKILSLFFPKKTVLYQIESKGKVEAIYSTSKESRSYPVAVLVNESSASASEILASCFQENYEKSIVIGTRSYGKGTVQKSQTLSNGTSIKYTTEKWLTAKGAWLNDTGLLPDIEIKQTETYYENPTVENDTQLQVAIQELGKMQEKV